MSDGPNGWLDQEELDAAEHRARYSTDEVEVHTLARQTLLRLISEVRCWRQRESSRSSSGAVA